MHSKAQLEIFAVYYSAALIFSLFSVQLYTNSVSAVGTSQSMNYVLGLGVPLLLASISSIVTGWFLYKSESKNRGSPIIWGLFGLVGNLLSVVIYLLVQVLEEKSN